MAQARRPDPAPLRTNEWAPVFAGIIAFAIAFVVLLTQHAEMARHGQGWWLWVALSGVLLGLWGLCLLELRHRGLRRAADRAAQRGSGDPPKPDPDAASPA